jgi:hypothetical protein
MELLREFLVGVGLDTECFTDGKHLEQEWEFASKSFTDIRREQGLVILDHFEEGTLGLDIFRGKRRVCAHPEL